MFHLNGTLLILSTTSVESHHTTNKRSLHQYTVDCTEQYTTFSCSSANRRCYLTLKLWPNVDANRYKFQTRVQHVFRLATNLNGVDLHRLWETSNLKVSVQIPYRFPMQCKCGQWLPPVKPQFSRMSITNDWKRNLNRKLVDSFLYQSHTSFQALFTIYLHF